ncbi:response regulator transcription factor [Fulvivirga sp. M361]|uniref:LytR/AlgR family response regulator transcription factor n=1 Tax=Fulvivirga sp. M361 TaxID=2594266 RepID=UPI00117B3CE7|nr:response regulator transcription factor [Fulvivirga sp. M361]TRX46484.1 response regulator transcription factor [Fulvivirga sp. M361]
MEQTTVFIVENEILIASKLRILLENHNYAVLGHSATGDAAISQIRKLKPDIVLMDVKIDGELDGIEVTEIIQKDVNSIVIYITQTHGNSQVFDQAKKTRPYAFLPKPFSESELLRTLELAILNSHKSAPAKEAFYDNQRIFIRQNYGYNKLEVRRILFIKAEGSYSKIVTEKDEYIVSDNLNTFFSKLPPTSLVRCHRSYIINLDKVTGFDEISIMIDEKERIPIGRTYTKIKDLFKKV